MTCDTTTTPPSADQPSGRRRRRRVAIIVVILCLAGVLSWTLVSNLVLTESFRMNWARCHASLSEAKQADLAERNRQFVVEKLGLPASVTIERIGSNAQWAGDCNWGDGDDDPDRVYAMTTRVNLKIPTLPTVEAWFAAHPDNPYGAGLDAAFDQDLYGKFWDVFHHLGRKLQTMGFSVQGDVEAQGGNPQTRSLSLRSGGVTVDFGFDAASPVISMTRYW